MDVHVSDLALPQCRLQTGMWGAFGKPQRTVARVHMGRVIMYIHTKLQNKEHVIEALRRAKFKFPGRQKIHISKKWGFTKFNADEFEDMVAEKRLIPDGCGVKYIPNRGPLDKWRALHSWGLPICCPHLILTNKFYFLSKKKKKFEEDVVEEVKESKLKRGINWIKAHKTEIALGAVAVVGGMVGYALGNAKEDDTVAIKSGEDYLKVTEKSEEPVDVELTSEEPVSEEA